MTIISTYINTKLESNESELETMTAPFEPSTIDIKTQTIALSDIMERFQAQKIDLIPDIQPKGGIWNIAQKSRFIESLLLRLPLPVFYVIADDDDCWIIMDGWQRLATLDEFIPAIEIEDEAKFALQQLEFLQECENKLFYQLPRGMQRRILETKQIFHIIQPETPKDVIRTLFKRINTGGVTLSAQQIRHVLYQGASTAFLNRLANSAAFKQATHHRVSNEQMMGSELVLRYLAFTLTPPEQYQTQDIDQFMSDAMVQLNQASPKFLQQQEAHFERAMDAAYRIFQDKAFCKQYRDDASPFPINKALFEIWSIALSQCSDEQLAVLFDNTETVNDLFIELLTGNYLPFKLLIENISDIDFEGSISQKTAHVNKVHFRFKAIRGLIMDILEECSSE